MNAKQLKDSILQLAVQGKLVPQVEGESAEELLKCIAREKSKLKVKSKPLKPITPEELPFDIPSNWAWARLGDVVSILGDGIHGTPQYDDTGEIFFINGNNLNNGEIKIKQDTKRVSIEEATKHKRILNDTTVLTSINGTIGNVAFYRNEPVILGKSACYFNLMCGIEKNFIKILLETNYYLKYTLKIATGTTIKNVPLSGMKNFLVPLPPLEEQKRIVAKIESLLPLVERYGMAESELSKLEENFPTALKKSILQEAVQGRLVPQDPHEEPANVLLGRIKAEKARLKVKSKPLKPITPEELPFDIPSNWAWARLGDVFNLINGDRGKNYPSKEKLSSSGVIPFISAINIRNHTINNENLLYLSQAQYDSLGNGKLIKNDIVVCIRGSLGKFCIYPFEFGAIASSLVILRKYNELETKYLMLYLDSFLFSDEIKKYNNGTAQPNLSARDLQKFLIPIPPLEEQKRIVAKVEELLQHCGGLG